MHQVLSGLATGGIYACIALALVMIYQATTPHQFRAGRDGDVLDLYRVVPDRGRLPYWGAFAATVAIAFIIGVVIERVIIRPIARKSELAVVVVFIGLLVIFNSVAGWIWTLQPSRPSRARFLRPSFPATNTFRPHEIGAMLITLVVLVAALRLLPLHAARPRHAGGRAESGVEPAGRHPGRLDAGARLGPGRRHRRHRRHDGRARSSISIPT